MRSLRPPLTSEPPEAFIHRGGGHGMPDATSGRRAYDPGASHPYPTERLDAVLARIADEPEIQTYLRAQNVNAVIRKRFNDHGPKHIEIVRNRALQLYGLLVAAGVEFNGARDQGLDPADEPVIIALAATLHDIGHVVHRDDHSYYSIPLASDILDRLLPEFPWYDTPEVVRMKAEILHAILCHHTAEEPLTREAGVIRVADGLDMERGRSRIPFERGDRGINAISSQAIERVTLRAGEELPVLVEIEMTSAAGVFQVDTLLKAKLAESGLADAIRIVAINSARSEPLLERIEL